MITAEYIGPDPSLKGEKAIVQPTDNPRIIKVQVTRFDHPWSHGWYESPAKDWKPNDV